MSIHKIFSFGIYTLDYSYSDIIVRFAKPLLIGNQFIYFQQEVYLMIFRCQVVDEVQ